MFFLGKDAIRPFITKQPDEIYKTEKIETDVMFGFNSMVRLIQNEKKSYFMALITNLFQEFRTFYTSKLNKVYDFRDLDKNFTLVLPFRDINLPFDSEVSAFY